MLSYVYLPVIYTKIDLGMQKITHANIFYLPHTACVKQCNISTVKPAYGTTYIRQPLI